MLNLGKLSDLSSIESLQVEASWLAGRVASKNFDFCLQGICAEEAVQRLIPQSRKTPGIKYDLMAMGKRIEVKSKKYTNDPKWWNTTNYDYFLANSQNIDYVFYCPIINDTIYLKWIAKADTFPSYMRSGFSSYYDQNKAIKDGQCFSVQSPNDVIYILSA